jgi:hypothetical protein
MIVFHLPSNGLRDVGHSTEELNAHCIVSLIQLHGKRHSSMIRTTVRVAHPTKWLSFDFDAVAVQVVIRLGSLILFEDQDFA